MSSATVIGIGVGGPRKGFHAVALSEILVAFQGIDEILLAPVHLRCSYGAGDLRFGERFRDMVRMDGPNSICLDFSRFCSASTPLADWRQSSWPVRGTDRPLRVWESW